MQKFTFKWPGILLGILLLSQQLIAQQAGPETYKALIMKNAEKLGISAADASEAVITNAYTDDNTQITYVYVQQSFKQIKVYNTIVTVAFRQGSYLYSSGSFVKNISTKANTPAPSKSYTDAVLSAAKHLNLDAPADLRMIANNFDAQKKYIVSSGNIAKQNIDVSLYWTPSDDKEKVTLTWNVNIDVKGAPDWWNVRINAQTGEFVQKDSWIVEENNTTSIPEIKALKTEAIKQPSVKGKSKIVKPVTPPLLLNAPPPNVTSANYRIVPFPLESPNFGSVATVNNPWLLAGTSNNATTHGWHFDGTNNYNITRGNNVFTFLDVANSNVPNATTNWPDTSSTAAPSLTFVNDPLFTQQPISSTGNRNKKFALDNLFYWNNLIHDLFYQYGFTEAAGNFQADNLSRGGAGNDYVSAQAMDGAGYSNANFGTPVDGQSGRMQMYLWFGTSYCTINSPATIAGTVPAQEAGLVTSVSNKLVDKGPLTGNVVWYNDNATGTVHSGCAPAANASSIAGNIALIDAFGGTNCSTYAFKIRNAQNAGAIGVIVYSSTNSLIGIGGSDTNALRITIPVVSVTNATGTSIINQLNAGNTVSFTMVSGIYLDGDLDNGIIAHEYGHGISNRLTGGPANSSCLGNAEQGGEGWSDYFALMMTTNWATATLTTGANPRAIGTYAANQTASGGGIRRYPYSTNMSTNPVTYSLVNAASVHNNGEIWCSAIWDMTWNIIQQEGNINTNIFNNTNTGGNTIALNLVMTGLKLQPCGPGFLDARDAILAADSILYGKSHYCAIWSAFARRGMGFSARQGLPTSATDQTPATDLPGGIVFTQPLPVITSVNAQTTISHSARSSCLPVTGYVLRDTIPAGFTYVSSTPAGTLNGNVLTFPATNFAANESKIFSITLTAPAVGCAIDSVVNDNRENSTTGGLASTGTPGWVTSTTRSHTPSSAWYASELETPSTSTLTSSANTLAAPKNLSLLSFWHYFNTESTYDGGVVEYSTNGGTTWNDAGPLFMRNAYNSFMDNTTTLSGRRAFSGTNTNFQQVFINLTSLGNSPVMFRFDFRTDNGTGGTGWYVDDIIQTNGCGGFVKTGVYNSAGAVTDTILQPVFVTPGALPLTLLWFYANQVGGQVALDWKTVSEINVKDFAIEWSADGINWTNLSNSAALNGNANSYNFLHTKPVDGSNYYRIKMNDIDGRYTYSPVRLISVKNQNKPQVVLIPNPVTTDAVLYISREMKAKTVKVYDAAGSTVRRITVGAGVQQVKISTSDLPAGVYNVETIGAGKTVTRMLVQH